MTFTSGRGGGYQRLAPCPGSGNLSGSPDVNPSGERRRARLQAALVLGAVLGAAALPSLAGELPLSSGPPSHVRLEDRIVPATNRSVEVPVHVRETEGIDGLELMIDHDGEHLEFAEARAVDASWSIERISQYENRRLLIGLRKAAGSRVANGEERVLLVTFNIRDAFSGAPPFRVDTALSLGTQSDPPNTGSTHFYRIVRGERLPAPTVLRSAEVTVYHGDGIEIGWADLTRAKQEFVLPIHLTYLHDDRNAFSVGIDYDELFLRVLGVDGVSPPLASAQIEHVVHEGRGRATFDIVLGSGLRGPFARLHVANLRIHYTGNAPPDGRMSVQARLFEGDAAEALAGGGDGGGASYGSSIPGLLTILPDHFVRGNVDSSLTLGTGGRIVPAPDLTDAMLLLDALFKGQQTILCDDAADTNDSGQIEVSDAVLLLGHFFRGGPPPQWPYPLPGTDADASDHLGCDTPLPVFRPR